MAKKVISFTIDMETLERFKKHCTEKTINKSLLVEKLIKSYLEGE